MPQSGDRVVPVRDAVPVRFGADTVARLTPASVLPVTAARGSWLQVSAPPISGWVLRDDVVVESYLTTLCSKCIAQFPDDPFAYNLRGIHAYRQGRHREAIDDFSQVLRLAPQDATALSNRGGALHALGEYQRALDDHDAAIRAEPDAAANFFNRGLTRQRLERFADAAADFREAVRLTQPDRTTVVTVGIGATSSRSATGYRLQLGRTLELAGEHRAARTVYEEALRLDPTDSNAANALAWLLATAPDVKVRDVPTAIRLARQACEASQWSTANYLDTLAAAYASAGDFRSAVRWQRRALERLGAHEPERLDLARRLELYEGGIAYLAPPRDKSAQD